jgi:hypothetical protein
MVSKESKKLLAIAVLHIKMIKYIQDKVIDIGQ